jgi:hypothetical protein
MEWHADFQVRSGWKILRELELGCPNLGLAVGLKPKAAQWAYWVSWALLIKAWYFTEPAPSLRQSEHDFARRTKPM